MSCCNPKIGCIALSSAASVIAGIITALLTITGRITITSAFSWVALGIAIGFLALTFAVTGLRRSEKPCCKTLTIQLTGILGTAITSVILLGVNFAATSIIGAIIAGTLLAFLTLTIATTACLTKCHSSCDE